MSSYALYKLQRSINARKNAKYARKYRRMRKRYPRSKYATLHVKRGQDWTTDMFGPADTQDATQLENRKKWGWRGKGGYWGKYIGGLIGDKVGDFAGAAISSRYPGIGTTLSGIGSALAQAHRRARGQGAYVTNDIVNGGEGNPAPVFNANTEGTVVISNREYIADIFAPPTAGAFANQTFSLNPGIERTFPWLCQVAENYEEYILHQCIFTYKATVADFAAATGQVGQITMATQYNASAPAFADKQTMMQYAFACSGKTSQDVLHGIECDPSKNAGARGHFIRNGPIPIGSTGDLNMYDHGTLNLAVSDCPSGYVGQQMGELWVSYTVELRKPKFVTANGWGISRDVFVATQGDSRWPFNNGDRAYLGQQNNLGITLTPPPIPGTTTIGQYLPSVTGVIMLENSAQAALATSDYLSFILTIPDYYSGNLRILYRMVGVPNNTCQAFAVYGAPGSNMRAVNDVPLVNNATQLLTWSNSTFTESLQNGSTAVEFHIRVDTPVNGIRNRIFFTIRSTAVLQTTLGFYLNVEEYNSQFNLKQDGTNDRLGLVSWATGQVANLG